MAYLDNVRFVDILATGSCTIVTFLENTFIFCNVEFLVKVNLQFLVMGFLFSDHLCTVWKSAWQNFMQHILLEHSKIYRKSRSLNCQIISKSFILSHQVVCWPYFGPY